MSTEYIASTIPAQVIRVSDTTLFRIAMEQFGDPLQWVSIAQLNGLIDPWIAAPYEILIPPVLPSGTPTGILDYADPSLNTGAINPVSAPPGTSGAIVLGPQVSTGGPYLDFSQSQDSQYLPLL